MRIQVMPLTPVTKGAFTETPFVLVVDGEGAQDILNPAQAHALRDELGAASILVTNDALDVGTPVVLTDEQQAQILERIRARGEVSGGPRRTRHIDVCTETGILTVDGDLTGHLVEDEPVTTVLGAHDQLRRMTFVLAEDFGPDTEGE